MHLYWYLLIINCLVSNKSRLWFSGSAGAVWFVLFFNPKWILFLAFTWNFNRATKNYVIVSYLIIRINIYNLPSFTTSQIYGQYSNSKAVVVSKGKCFHKCLWCPISLLLMKWIVSKKRHICHTPSEFVLCWVENQTGSNGRVDIYQNHSWPRSMHVVHVRL